MHQEEIAIAGAGLSGSILAHKLAMRGYKITIFESRSHVAGNCYTERDESTGVLVHKYGPHIFHTNNKNTWDFVNKYDEFMPYINRVKATSGGKVFSLPINLLTINQFFDKVFKPDEAEAYIKSLSDQSIDEPKSFEEQALKFIGRDLYEAFFKGYTIKQWGLSPEDLPASILKRLPIRFNYDDNYFSHIYQGMPKHGYTHLVNQWLDHENIEVMLDTHFSREQGRDYSHVFYTGPLDEYFGRCYGGLGYRTLDFEVFRTSGDYQGGAVMNYCDESVPYTRITEHKHFSPWESHSQTICFREYSRGWKDGDIPYYPIRQLKEKEVLSKYVELAKCESGITFVGRLATYRYIDMDVAIMEALDAYKIFVNNRKLMKEQPVFTVDVM